MVGSIALHALIVIWFLIPRADIEMPQQIIEITIASSPHLFSEKDDYIKSNKPEEKVVQNNEDGILSKPTEKLEARKSDSSPAKLLSEFETSEIITTTPLFDAEYLQNTPPEYPSSAKRLGIEGLVMLNVKVTNEGFPESIEVSKSSGFPILDKSALEAVSKWRFIPAKKMGRSVHALVVVPIEFRID